MGGCGGGIGGTVCRLHEGEPHPMSAWKDGGRNHHAHVHPPHATPPHQPQTVAHSQQVYPRLPPLSFEESQAQMHVALEHMGARKIGIEARSQRFNKPSKLLKQKTLKMPQNVESASIDV